MPESSPRAYQEQKTGWGPGLREYHARAYAGVLLLGTAVVQFAGGTLTACKDRNAGSSKSSRPAVSVPAPERPQSGGRFRCAGIRYTDHGKSGTWEPRLAGSPRPSRPWIEGTVHLGIISKRASYDYNTKETRRLSITDAHDAEVTNVTMTVKWNEEVNGDVKTSGRECRPWLDIERLGVGEARPEPTLPVERVAATWPSLG